MSRLPAVAATVGAVLWIVIVLVIIGTGHGPHPKAIHVEYGAPNEVGVSCPDGHDPRVIGMEEQTLIVTCAK